MATNTDTTTDDRDPTTDRNGIDGETLAAVAEVLTDRYEARLDGEVTSAAEQAITSGELAAEVTGEDAEANPKTREAMKILMRERDLPIIGDHRGNWIPVDGDRIEEKLDSLDQRIAGIEERKQLLAENWRRWEQDDGEDGQTVADVSIPAAVRAVLDGAAVDRAVLVERVSKRADADPDAVEERLDDLEREGFLYDSGDGLRLP